MKVDFLRLTGILFVSGLIGLLTGQFMLCLFTGLLLYCIWYYRILRRLLDWLQQRTDNNAPELPGVIDEICREIDFLKSRHKQREFKLSGFLRRFQEATSALPDGVVVLGENGTIEWANKKANEYLDIRWPHDANQRIANLVRNPELIRFLKSTGNNKPDSSLQLDSPARASQKLEFRITSYGDSQKLLFIRDITDIYRVNQMRKDFIANASHELRSPLTVITGYLEGFSDDTETCPESWRTPVEQMRKQATRMQRLLEDLLRLSTLESTDEQKDLEPVRVPEILGTIYQEAQTLSGLMEHIFYLETDPDLWVKGSHGELFSAFSNIIFNAVQHTPGRGIIRIRWYADEEGAHLEVKDNGPGIAPEHLPRLTERFYRVDKGRSREKGGTGLGLAIVKHVLFRHGGKLHIESIPGQGSTFRCDLPSRLVIYRNDLQDSSLSA
ncbi:MAG TPA: phosphate regulon sensor histidine kinase PhoR [Gammaproteobacteria bacterium]|nr:phosphate regulon sensor histidine kinase PhoR [Gammaproteobacteria bacterium]